MIDLTTCPPPVEARELLSEFALTGRQEPFEEVVRRYGGMVFGVCYDVTKNRQDAEDATQAAFLTLAVQVRCGQTIHAIGPWLQQVSRRMSLDICRSRKRRRNREDVHGEAWNDRQETVDADGSGNGFGQAPDTAAGWEELRHIIREELHELPPKYRMPLILHYYGGLSREDMAKELGCRANTLGVRLHRARQLLGKRLAQRGITLASVVVGALMAEIVAESVTQNLICSTAQAAAMMSAGQSAGGLVSFSIVQMARNAARALAVAKIKVALAATLLAGGAMAMGAEFAATAGYLDLPSIQIIHRKVKDFFNWKAPAWKPQIQASSDRAGTDNVAVAEPRPASDVPPARGTIVPVTIDPVPPPPRQARAVPASGSPPGWWAGRPSPKLVTPTEPVASNAPARQVTPHAHSPELPPPVPRHVETPGVAAPLRPASRGGENRSPIHVDSRPPARSRPAPSPRGGGAKPMPALPQYPPLPLEVASSQAFANAMRAAEPTRPYDPLPTEPQGGTLRDGVLYVNGAPQVALTSSNTLVYAAVPMAVDPSTYRIEGQHVANTRVVVGEANTGTVHHVAGVHTVDRIVLASQSTGKGVYQLDSGELAVTTAPASDPMPHGIVVGGAGEGLLVLGNDSTPGRIIQSGAGQAPDLTIGSGLMARGTVSGWGEVRLTGRLINNGRVIAEGHGQDRTLDLSHVTTVTHDFKNRDIRGWYARGGGQLNLPVIPTSAGTASYTWGDADAPTSLSYVNSARVTLRDAESTGEMIISLLATDRTDLPAFPPEHTLVSAWAFDARAAEGGPTVPRGGVDLLVRYDSARAAELGLSESVLKLWTFEEGQWIRHDLDPGFLRDPSKHTLFVHLNDANFSHFAVSAPEPGALGLAVIAAGILTMRRRHRPTR